jgi:ketosteroid isomerase-like protein
MSQENVDWARRGYAILNAAYKSGDVNDLLSLAEETWDPDIVLSTTGKMLPESGEWRGHEGLLRFTTAQMEAFSQMWIEPQEYIDADDRLVVPVRFGGRARHTGIEVEFSAVHVFTLRNGKATRLDVFVSKAEALEAVGLSEQDAHDDSGIRSMRPGSRGRDRTT